MGDAKCDDGRLCARGLFPCPETFRSPRLETQRANTDFVRPGVLSADDSDGVCRTGCNFQASAHVQLRRERLASRNYCHPPFVAETWITMTIDPRLHRIVAAQPGGRLIVEG